MRANARATRSIAIKCTAIVASVFAVLNVSGFAQSNTSNDRFRSSLSVARTYVAARSATYENVQLPRNFSVPPLFASIVESMLEKSATFRRQCARIARADFLTVILSPVPPSPRRRALAWTEILRRPDDRLEAVVQNGRSGEATELIAHELEHIIEQLDGVDLKTLARVRSTGVHECECVDGGAYETQRAIAIGLRVGEEMRERSP